MFLHHFVCSVYFPTVQKHTGIETISHFYWKNDKGVEPANGIQPAFSGDFVIWCLPTGFLPSSAVVSIYFFKPPYAIGSVPSLSGDAIAYR